MDVPSPCIDICTLDRHDVCVGCGRQLDEIAAWGAAAAEVKLRIVAAARERLARMQPLPQDKAASR